MANDPKVDKKTAKGQDEGGFAPHPETPGPPEHFDPHSYAPPANADEAKGPEDNKHPISDQKPSVPKGAGHERAQGGLPETQPTTKKQ